MSIFVSTARSALRADRRWHPSHMYNWTPMQPRPQDCFARGWGGCIWTHSAGDTARSSPGDEVALDSQCREHGYLQVDGENK